MGGKISAAMERALERVARGETVYAAAKAEGLTGTGIRRSPQYQLLLVAGKVNIGRKVAK